MIVYLVIVYLNLNTLLILLQIELTVNIFRSIPWYLQWVMFISWFELGFEALTVLHWKDVDYIGERMKTINTFESIRKHLNEILK